MINTEKEGSEREREREHCRLHAGMSTQTESYVSLFAGFTTRAFCAVRREGPSEGSQQKCGSEVVIKE